MNYDVNIYRILMSSVVDVCVHRNLDEKLMEVHKVITEPMHNHLTQNSLVLYAVEKFRLNVDSIR